MSADDNPDKTAARSGNKAGRARRSPKDRLKAMQAKHEETPQPAPPARTPAPGGATGSGLMADLQAAMAAGKDSGGTILQKVQKVLSGPDGRIDPQRARMALMFVRKQAADPNAPRHDLAKRIEGMIRNMPPQQRQRLMAAAGISGPAAAGMGGGKGGAAGAAMGGGGGGLKTLARQLGGGGARGGNARNG